MNVLHLLGELRPSGAEVMLKLAAPHWQKAGCELIALAAAPNVGEYAFQLESAGFKILHLPFGRGHDLLGWAKSYLEIIRRENIDIVHVHGEKNNLLSTTLPKLAGCRVFRTVHNNFPYNGTLRIRKSIERRTSRFFGCRSIAISPSVQANERNRLHNPTTLCWNWFDDAFFRPPTHVERAAARSDIGLTENDIALVSVGNGNDVKNYAAIVEALGKLRVASGELSVKTSGHASPASPHPPHLTRHASPATLPPSLLYLFVGNEHPDQVERTTVEKLGLSASVRFCGPQADVRKYLWAADIFVMPSLYEGFGLAAVEALATGIPSIFSEVPGLNDFREFPFAIEWCGTEAKSISEKIGGMMANGGSRIRNLESAAAVRAEFGVERRASEYLRLWQGRG